jgi:hypothetical protein
MMTTMMMNKMTKMWEEEKHDGNENKKSRGDGQRRRIYRLVFCDVELE